LHTEQLVFRINVSFRDTDHADRCVKGSNEFGGGLSLSFKGFAGGGEFRIGFFDAFLKATDEGSAHKDSGVNHITAVDVVAGDADGIVIGIFYSDTRCRCLDSVDGVDQGVSCIKDDFLNGVPRQRRRLGCGHS